jgi:hypothetical protein
LIDGSYLRFLFEDNKENQTFTLTSPKDPNQKIIANYSQPDTEQLIWEGTWDGKPFKAKLKKTEKKFLLLDRGFNWINEVPYHR